MIGFGDGSWVLPSQSPLILEAGKEYLLRDGRLWRRALNVAHSVSVGILEAGREDWEGLADHRPLSTDSKLFNGSLVCTSQEGGAGALPSPCMVSLMWTTPSWDMQNSPSSLVLSCWPNGKSPNSTLASPTMQLGDIR